MKRPVRMASAGLAALTLGALVACGSSSSGNLASATSPPATPTPTAGTSSEPVVVITPSSDSSTPTTQPAKAGKLTYGASGDAFAAAAHCVWQPDASSSGDVVLGPQPSAEGSCRFADGTTVDVTIYKNRGDQVVATAMAKGFLGGLIPPGETWYYAVGEGWIASDQNGTKEAAKTAADAAHGSVREFKASS